MAHNRLNPVVLSYFIKIKPVLKLITIILTFVTQLEVSNAQTQETSVFKPINGEKTTSKLVDFATNNTPNNQRNLPNNSQSQPLVDYFTRSLQNYIGGGGVGVTASAAVSNAQSGPGAGFFAPNYGQFGAIAGAGQNFGLQGAQFGFGGNKGPGGQFPPGPPPPFPFPLGQYPGVGPGGFGLPGGNGGLGVPGGGNGFGVQGGGNGFGIGKPQFPQISPQFPFISNPQTGGQGGFFHPGFSGQGQGYPYSPVNNNGIGSLYFGLPRQIRVPGRIEISLSGSDAEITCEFPRFLILIQKVYWHHKFDDPYGTYYDSTNGFGPRVTVITVNKWKTKLQIRDYNEDDFGTYRCLTAAVLPEESSAASVNGDNTGQFLLRSPSTTTENTLSPEFITRLKLPEKSKTRTEKDLKYIPETKRVARKIRFSRSASIEKPQISTRRIDTIKTNPSSRDMKNIGAESVYDPYYFNNNYPQNYNQGPTQRNYFLDNSLHHPSSGGPFSTSTISPLGFAGHSQLQNSRYNILTGGYGFPNYPQQGQGSSSFGPYAPYYKPSYGLFTIYQEIKFAPVRIGNSSPRSNII